MIKIEDWIKCLEEERRGYSIKRKIGLFLLLLFFSSVFFVDYLSNYFGDLIVVILIIVMFFLGMKLSSNSLRKIDLLILDLYSIGNRIEQFDQKSDIFIKKNKSILKNCLNDISHLKKIFVEGESYYINNIQNFLKNLDTIILKLNNLNQINSEIKLDILASEIKELAILIRDENSLLDEKPIEKVNNILNSLKDIEKKEIRKPVFQTISNYLMRNFWSSLPPILKIIIIISIVGIILYNILLVIITQFLGFDNSTAPNNAFTGTIFLLVPLIYHLLKSVEWHLERSR